MIASSARKAVLKAEMKEIINFPLYLQPLR